MAKFRGELNKRNNQMQIEVTEIESCKLAIHYESNALEIMDKRAEVLNSFKKAPVPGNRPGKASIEAIKQHYGKQIDESLKRALAEDAYHNTLFEKKLRPHGAPKFNNMLLNGGKFICEFEVLTKPDFELPDWKNLEIPRPHETETIAGVSAKMIQEMRVRLGEAVPFSETDFVQQGDNVIVDYEATVDGVKMDSLSTEGEMMTIGTNPLQGFDNNLLGMVAGETREFDFQAPTGGLPSLEGKTIHFKVTLGTGAKVIPCGLDDELAKKFGKETYKELEELVGQAAFARVANMQKLQIQEASSRKLVADTVVAVPNWMSLSEAQYLAQQSKLDWNVMSDSDKEKFITMAEQNVKLALILDKIRETTPETQLTDQEVFEIIKQNLAQTKMTQSLDEVIQQMSRTGYLQILFSRIRDERTMDHVVKNVKLID
jgi:trigger factor